MCLKKTSEKEMVLVEGFYITATLADEKMGILIGGEVVFDFPVLEKIGNYEEERSFVAEEHGNGVGIAVEIGNKRVEVEYYPIEDYWQILEDGVIIEAKE